MYQTGCDSRHGNEFHQVVECTSQAMFGGCFQWVLGAACEADEWLTSAVAVRVCRPPFSHSQSNLQQYPWHKRHL